MKLVETFAGKDGEERGSLKEWQKFQWCSLLIHAARGLI